MSGANVIVIRPVELQAVAVRLGSAAETLTAGSRRVGLATGGVRLNGRDPRFGFGKFHRRRQNVERRLITVGRGLDHDEQVLRYTAEEAEVGDSGAALLMTLDRIAEVIDRQPPSVRNSVFHGELVARRAELLAEISGGSRVGSVVFGVYSANGGSLFDLFDGAAVDGGAALEGAVVDLANEGLIDEAQQLDRALAVARLVTSGGGPFPGSPSASNRGGIEASAEAQADAEARAEAALAERMAEFDRLVDGLGSNGYGANGHGVNGVDVAVAANSLRTGGLPESGEVQVLVDQLSTVFGADGGWVRLSDRQESWLPLSMRLALGDGGWVDARAVVAPGHLRSAPDDGRFRAYGDAVETRVDVIAELGRAGVDAPKGGATLAALLGDMVLPSGRGDVATSTHRIVADAVADPSVGVGAAFFARLDADQVRIFAESVWAEAPFSVSDGQPIDTADAVLARYGDGLAAADQQGLLTFSAADLFGDEIGAWFAGPMMAASATYTEAFAVEAAEALLAAGRAPGSYGVNDPRGMALDQVSRHGADGSVALFDRLGTDYLETLLWNPEPIEFGGSAGSAASVGAAHPLYKVFANALDGVAAGDIGSGRYPGLAADVVIHAGREHGGEAAPLATGDVIQHAFLSDKLLLAPEFAYLAGGARSTGYSDRFPSDGDVAHAVETVFASGSGDGLTAMANLIMGEVTFASWNVEGAAGISHESVAVSSEMLASVSIGEFNADLHAARVADATVERNKYIGSALVTALPGALPLKAAASVGTGALVNLGSGPAFDLFEADSEMGVMREDWFAIRLRGEDLQRQMIATLVELGAVDVDPATYDPLSHGEVTVYSADGTPSGTLSQWTDRVAEIALEAGLQETDLVDFDG